MLKLYITPFNNKGWLTNTNPNLKIYVPQSVLATYTADPEWSTAFTNKIFAIPDTGWWN
jgi:hypothetical protein